MLSRWVLILFALSTPSLGSDSKVTVKGSWPGKEWKTARPEEVGLDANKLAEAKAYALTGGGSGIITRHGREVMVWGDRWKRYDLKSTTKSIGFTAMGLALQDGKLKLKDRATQRHPKFGVPPEENENTGWLKEITLWHLATQTAGFEKPGGYKRVTFAPGTRWRYSDGGPNWLAECVTLAYGQDLQELMFERVFRHLHIERAHLKWRKNAYRPALIQDIPRREFGSGISACVDAMARIGYLYLRGGDWEGREILPRRFVDLVRTTPKALEGLPVLDRENFGNASSHYGLLWWTNADGTLKGVPRDTYWSWGLYDSLIVVFPTLDIVVARAGASWKREWDGHYTVLKPFLEPIARSVPQLRKTGERP